MRNRAPHPIATLVSLLLVEQQFRLDNLNPQVFKSLVDLRVLRNCVSVARKVKPPVDDSLASSSSVACVVQTGRCC
jgi:hypothetical protein